MTLWPARPPPHHRRPACARPARDGQQLQIGLAVPLQPGARGSLRTVPWASAAPPGTTPGVGRWSSSPARDVVAGEGRGPRRGGGETEMDRRTARGRRSSSQQDRLRPRSGRPAPIDTTLRRKPHSTAPFGASELALGPLKGRPSHRRGSVGNLKPSNDSEHRAHRRHRRHNAMTTIGHLNAGEAGRCMTETPRLRAADNSVDRVFGNRFDKDGRAHDDCIACRFDEDSSDLTPTRRRDVRPTVVFELIDRTTASDACARCLDGLDPPDNPPAPAAVSCLDICAGRLTCGTCVS